MHRHLKVGEVTLTLDWFKIWHICTKPCLPVTAKCFDYSPSQSHGHLVKVFNYRHIMRESRKKTFKPYHITPHVKRLGRASNPTEWDWLETGCRSRTIFFPIVTLLDAFSPESSASCLSTISTSKIKGDLWWDGQFIPTWQVGYSQGCPSLKLPSTCQRRFLINHLKRRRKLAPRQTRG